MPFIRITVLAASLDTGRIGRLQQATKELMISVMRKPIDGIAVHVERAAPGSWSIAGKKVATAAYVEAIIGRGTNTAAEKARFMAEMMTALRAELGPDLAEESYVVLHELPMESYGRGGLSRAERDRRPHAPLLEAARAS
jgi:4-oxalocrotonate tautomerase